MKYAFIRTMLMAGLWAFWITEAYTGLESLITLIILSALSIALFFLVPLMKIPQISYMLQLLLVMVGTIITHYTPLIMWAVVFLILMEAAVTLGKDQFRQSLFATAAFLIVVAIYSYPITDYEIWIIVVFFLFSTYKVNEDRLESKEQRVLYEQLLGEYRSLKRLQFVTEQHSKAEERTRIARDIHDSVGHKLTALLMQIEMLSIQNGKEGYRDLKRLAEDSLEETREAVRTLKDGELSGIQSVLQLVRKLESESHIQIQLTTRQGILSSRFTNEQNVALYRSIQEGVTNAMRHAHVREIRVTLGKTAQGHASLVIVNNVKDPVPIKPGFGLTSMRERLEKIGGRLDIQQTDREFSLTISFPIEEA
ncbi:histidine kinase [Rossellomorea marisflavi]|uniref:sensor histidine kinase n=1 Tax=Rossellomorea marisflavi TaxID=189381 RepID=UPI0025C9CE75|nr:sensor histidine kinase [Rossellomorea marisflavi]UTE72715.1 sensor histidine kinase [Rossellomorea marisflavi]GLI84744.1 histidine kinase [Rossellomorea marisflavi]